MDIEDGKIKDVNSVANPYYASHGEPGQVPAFIRDQGANVMLAGGMGGRAVAFFEQFGIEAVTGASGNVKDAVEAYLGGKIEGAEPCEDEGTHEAIEAKVPPPGEFEGDEISRLKEEMAALRRQLAETQKRLSELEKR